MAAARTGPRRCHRHQGRPPRRCTWRRRAPRPAAVSSRHDGNSPVSIVRQTTGGRTCVIPRLHRQPGRATGAGRQSPDRRPTRSTACPRQPGGRHDPIRGASTQPERRRHDASRPRRARHHPMVRTSQRSNRLRPIFGELQTRLAVAAWHASNQRCRQGDLGAAGGSLDDDQVYGAHVGSPGPLGLRVAANCVQ